MIRQLGPLSIFRFGPLVQLGEGCGCRLLTRLSFTVALFLGSLFLVACPARTSIERINRDPGRYVGKEVAIAGHVTTSFGALGSGVFEVDDGSGRMWVFSQSYGVPSNGARV